MITTKSLTLISLSLIGSLALTLLQGCSAPPPTHDQIKEQVVADTVRVTTPMERASVLTDVMTTKLRLNESQSARVAKLNLDYSTRFSILMDSTNPSISKRNEFLRLSAEKEAKLLSILSPTQAGAYEASKAEFLDTYRIM